MIVSKLADEQTSPPPTLPTRRKPLDYFNPYAARDRFWRLFGNREKAKEYVKTLAIVIPITLIIWIYAEREQVVVQGVSDVPVRINSSDPTLDVEMVGGPDHKVNLKLTGPQQALERVRQQLTSGITINLLSSMPVGNNEPVNIAERIQNMELFKSNGVTVLDPQTIQPLNVNIDQHLQLDLPVEIPPAVTNLTADTRFDPPKVTISGPRHLFLPGLKVYADLAGNESLNKPGPHTVTRVHVMLSAPQEGLRVVPPMVNAEIVVRNADEEYTIPNIPIHIDCTALLLTKYDIAVSGGYTTKPTVVIGPPEEIKKLQDGSFPPSAVLEVVEADSGAAQPRKPLHYVLPEGVKVKPDSQQEVDFTLTPK